MYLNWLLDIYTPYSMVDARCSSSILCYLSDRIGRNTHCQLLKNDISHCIDISVPARFDCHPTFTLFLKEAIRILSLFQTQYNVRVCLTSEGREELWWPAHLLPFQAWPLILSGMTITVMGNELWLPWVSLDCTMCCLNIGWRTHSLGAIAFMASWSPWVRCG